MASTPGVFSVQQLTDLGGPLVGGRLYTYAFGTTAHKTAYTDLNAAVAHTYTSDGSGGQYIALNARGELPAPLYLVSGSYDLALKRSDGSTVWTRRADPVSDAFQAQTGAGLVGFLYSLAYANGSLGKWLQDLATTAGAGFIGWVQAGAGAVLRLVRDRLRETVSVKDFGAVGAVGANEAADTAAFLAALATGKNVFVPEGTYYLSSTVSVGYGQRLYGAGQYKTNIRYSGTGTAVYLGSAVLTSLVYNCELSDLTVFCTNRAASVFGVELQNCVYFNVANVSIFGSGNPNSAVPADQVLYGSGLYLHDNTIIGRVSHVSCRLWNFGRYYKTDATSQSRWTAAIVDGGQGEVANNMRGIVVGDPTIAFVSGAGCTFRDLSIQGNYTTGINIHAGENTTIDNCYFEGNANYDVAVGTPLGAPAPTCVKIINNSMASEGIGTTAYGTFPYLTKVYVDRGSFATIRDNDMSVSTAIPLIILAALSDQAVITGNRVNSAIAVTGRISDAGTSTLTADNHPEAPRVISSTLTRTLSAASGSVAYAGLGFRPTSVEFTGSVEGAPERFVGWCDASGGVRSRCMTTDAAANNFSTTDCIRLIKTGAGNEQKATLVSFDPDGFTLAWTKVGAPPANDLIVNYIARR